MLKSFIESGHISSVNQNGVTKLKIKLSEEKMQRISVERTNTARSGAFGAVGSLGSRQPLH